MKLFQAFLSALVCYLALAGIVSAQTQYLPQIAVGGTPTSTNLQTLVFLFNNGTDTISGSGQIFGDGGAPLPVVINRQGAPTASFAWTLMSRQTQRFLFTGASAALQTGWLKIVPDGNASVGVTLIYQLYSDSTLLSEAGVLPGPLQTNVTLVFDQLDGTDTGIALANPGSASMMITLNLINDMGQSLRTQSITLPRNGHVSRFVREFFTGTDLPLQGTVTIGGSMPFTAVGLRVNGLRLSTVPVFPSSRPQPQITRLSTDTGLQGQTINDFVITGSNLSNATSINFDPSMGITATIQSSSGSEVRGRIVIDATATVGNYNLTVTTRNLGLEQTSNALVFRVALNNNPLIDSLSPATADRGSTIDPFIITGTNLTGTTTISFDPSAGITVSNIQQTSDTEVRARLVISATADTGVRQVRVTTSVGMSNTRPFTITSGTMGPIISMINPASAREGETIELVINGSNLANTAFVDFQPGDGITTSIIGTPTDTEVHARVVFGAATTGPRLVSVRNSAGRSSDTAFFFLAANPMRPAIRSLSPASGRPGQTIDPFIISGSNLANVRSINFDPAAGITVSNIAATAGEVRARVVIDTSATVGTYQVTVISQVGTSPPATSLPMTFTLMAEPVQPGSYAGTTGQEFDLTFTVTASGITNVMTTITLNCSIGGMRTVTLSIPGPTVIAPDDRFLAIFTAGNGSDMVSGTFSGQFITGTMAQGSLIVPDRPTMSFGICGLPETSFTASRQ
jgi:hypothetical protein